MMHLDDPNQVTATSLIMMCLNGPLKTPSVCNSPDHVNMEIVLEHTSLDDIVNQSSLMTRGQVQMHNQYCLTTHNGETAFFVVMKVLSTTGTRVGSKHIPSKISLEWGGNKMMGPDFR